jgi:MoaA/NifB/PqqE/SkfB family radical SAM enzyme
MSELDLNRHFQTSRNINRQLNHTESRNNLPVVNSRPLKLGFDISDVCNVRCIFCLAEGGRKKRSDPDAFRRPEWLDPFEPLLPFINMAILSSYEAVLNPWLDQFVERFWKWRTPLQIFTNGNAFTPDISEYLLDHGLASLWCSFHGYKQETYEGIMKGSDYDKVLSNLMHMKLYARKKGYQHYVPTMVFCAMRRNIMELPDYVDLAHRVGARDIQVNYLLVTREGTGLEQEAMCFNPQLYDAMVLKAKIKATQLGINLKHQRLFSDGAKEADQGPCYKPWEHFNVKSNGSATVCCGGCGSLGNMFEQGFQQLWNSPRLIELRERINSDDRPKACRQCTRGLENPWDISTHVTYLRGKSGEEKRRLVEEMVAEAPDGVRRQFGEQLKQNTFKEHVAASCAA